MVKRKWWHNPDLRIWFLSAAHSKVEAEGELLLEKAAVGNEQTFAEECLQALERSYGGKIPLPKQVARKERLKRI